LAFNVTETSGDETIFCVIQRNLEDTSSIDDSITITVTKVLNDEINPVDDIVVIAPVDFILTDAATIDDSITIRMRVRDDLATIDDIIIIAPVTFALSDAVTIDDSITPTVTYRIDDAVTVDDSISLSIVKSVDDDLATVEDLIVIAPVLPYLMLQQLMIPLHLLLLTE